MRRKRYLVFNQGLLMTQVFLMIVFSAVIFSAEFSVTAAINQEQPAQIPDEIIADWEAQDGKSYDNSITEIKQAYPAIADKINKTGKDGYLQAAHLRRVQRMKDYEKELTKLLYAKHHNFGSTGQSVIGYVEDLNSDGFRGFGTWGEYGTSSKSNQYKTGNSGIYLLEFKNYYPEPVTVVEMKNKGVVRDPCPSWDGSYMVYAKTEDDNGYHIWEYDFATKQSRQLTDNIENISVSDFEPCVLPTGDIIFSSSRCFGHVDCNVNLTSNLYLMNKDGEYMRRIGFDQVHTFYPTLMENGSVMYSRWEYNDRNVHNCFGIFTMLPDGSQQNEWFGNQTEFPATFNQAREIPGSSGMKALATIGGHMGPYCGDLVYVDASKGRNNIGKIVATDRIAPRRALGSADGMTGVAESQKLFQNPYPLDEQYFLISYRKTSSDKFRVYFMDFDGNRELIAWDGSQSVSQPISLSKNEGNKPKIPKYQADYTKESAKVSVQDVYYGQGTEGVQSGSIEKIRVVAMEYRTDPAFGNTGANMGFQMTPVGRYNCSWEAKYIVGEAKIETDGSSAFIVPSDVPLFLQLIAKDGTCIQTMRSWMTLKPGEIFECIGCHEDKNASPPTKNPIARASNAKPLDKFYDLSGEVGSFYFPTVIQPLLDEHCATSSCHGSGSTKLDLKNGTPVETSTLGGDNAPAYRKWLKSYVNLSASKYVNGNAMNDYARPRAPKTFGSANSGLATRLVKDKHVADLPKEVSDKLMAWIDIGFQHSGTYTDDMPDNVKAKYIDRLERRVKQEAFEAKNIEKWIQAGQYNVPPYNTGVAVEKKDIVQPKKVVDNCNLNVRFISAARQLSVSLPAEGKIRLLDLQGRQVLSRIITRDAFVESATQSFKLEIPAGTYIVKFKGVKLSAEQVVSVL